MPELEWEARLYPGLGRDDRHRIRDLFVLPHEKVALRCAVGAFLADDAGKFRDLIFLCTKIPGRYPRFSRHKSLCRLREHSIENLR